ncbi:hypothetical protein IW261DRAFT_1511582, partial [Armillaria novae-zelandiae]
RSRQLHCCCLVIDVPIRGTIIHPIVDPDRDIDDLLEERTDELFRSFLERIAVIMGQAKVLAIMKEGARTNLIGHFVDIPTGEGVTLAGLPAFPVIPVDEHRLPLAFAVRPLGRALESTYGLSWPSPGRLPGSVGTVVVPPLDGSVSIYQADGRL